MVRRRRAPVRRARIAPRIWGLSAGCVNIAAGVLLRSRVLLQSVGRSCCWWTVGHPVGREFMSALANVAFHWVCSGAVTGFRHRLAKAVARARDVRRARAETGGPPLR